VPNEELVGGESGQRSESGHSVSSVVQPRRVSQPWSKHEQERLGPALPAQRIHCSLTGPPRQVPPESLPLHRNQPSLQEKRLVGEQCHGPTMSTNIAIWFIFNSTLNKLWSRKSEIAQNHTPSPLWSTQLALFATLCANCVPDPTGVLAARQ
jgi:hypothetical protein